MAFSPGVGENDGRSMLDFGPAQGCVGLARRHFEALTSQQFHEDASEVGLVFENQYASMLVLAGGSIDVTAADKPFYPSALGLSF
jgi:hypothetical protein